jgi:hypothetical protein
MARIRLLERDAGYMHVYCKIHCKKKVIQAEQESTYDVVHKQYEVVVYEARTLYQSKL